ncbi:MAG: 3-keto-disaccharide hydrolase [Planctomycetota bacterium]
MAIVVALSMGLLSACKAPEAGPGQEPERTTAAPAATTTDDGPPSVLSTLEPGKWVALFNGKNMKGWRVVEKYEFEMHGKIEVKDGEIRLGTGMPFSAITWTGDFPLEGYEVELETKRTSGVDIFAGTTFPIGESHASFIVGGWGDTVVGISSVDHMNAAENETTVVQGFDNKKWYRFRIRVTKPKIEAWINDKQVVDLERKGHKFSLYGGTDAMVPFGIFTWQSESALRNIRFRRLKPEAAKAEATP